MATTRDRALDAAVRLVGTQGVRALTHARVDAEAGLPRGSTSNWFRTRDALVAGVLVHIAEAERADLTAAMTPASTPGEVIDALCRVLDDATGRDAVRTRARYALFLERAGTPRIQPSMRVQRALFEQWTRDLLTGLGGGDPEAAGRGLVGGGGGVQARDHHQAAEMPVRPAIELVVRGCLPTA